MGQVEPWNYQAKDLKQREWQISTALDPRSEIISSAAGSTS